MTPEERITHTHILKKIETAMTEQAQPVNVSDAEAHIKAACKEIEELLLRKNRSYGNSALNPVRIFSKANAQEGIKVRIDDKLSRLAFGTGEFDEDVILDLLGYLILLRVAQQTGS